MDWDDIVEKYKGNENIINYNDKYILTNNYELILLLSAKYDLRLNKTEIKQISEIKKDINLVDFIFDEDYKQKIVYGFYVINKENLENLIIDKFPFGSYRKKITDNKRGEISWYISNEFKFINEILKIFQRKSNIDKKYIRRYDEYWDLRTDLDPNENFYIMKKVLYLKLMTILINCNEIRYIDTNDNISFILFKISEKQFGKDIENYFKNLFKYNIKYNTIKSDEKSDEIYNPELINKKHLILRNKKDDSIYVNSNNVLFNHNYEYDKAKIKNIYVKDSNIINNVLISPVLSIKLNYITSKTKQKYVEYFSNYHYFKKMENYDINYSLYDEKYISNNYENYNHYCLYNKIENSFMIISRIEYLYLRKYIEKNNNKNIIIFSKFNNTNDKLVSKMILDHDFNEPDENKLLNNDNNKYDYLLPLFMFKKLKTEDIIYLFNKLNSFKDNTKLINDSSFDSSLKSVFINHIACYSKINYESNNLAININKKSYY